MFPNAVCVFIGGLYHAEIIPGFIYVSGKIDWLVLATGSITMCFTQYPRLHQSWLSKTHNTPLHSRTHSQSNKMDITYKIYKNI